MVSIHHSSGYFEYCVDDVCRAMVNSDGVDVTYLTGQQTANGIPHIAGFLYASW